LSVLYPAPESRKTPQQCRAVVDVPSVCQHVRCGTDRPWVVAWKCVMSSPVSVEQPDDQLRLWPGWYGGRKSGRTCLM